MTTVTYLVSFSGMIVAVAKTRKEAEQIAKELNDESDEGGYGYEAIVIAEPKKK